MQPSVASGVTIAGVLVLQFLGLWLFVQGFFPYKPYFQGLSAPVQSQPAAVFDRITFVLIDALRSDFVFADSSPMSFTKGLIESGHGLGFTAYSTPPTVTMPRLKGLTTGSVPNFLDAVLNIAESDQSSSLAGQDNWLGQLKRKGGGRRLIMFGDDTWLKLFPGMFERSDGTTSFYVSDYTEVDHNVTRHIAPELGRSDWDAMILHYLGVDHIGHKGGPDSPLMAPKLAEMDGVVRDLYAGLERADRRDRKKSLLVLCGDHGMNDAGNHGGSSAGETSAALALLSPHMRVLEPAAATSPPDAASFRYHTKIDQADLVPSLSALLGIPVPKNNLGVLIPRLLKLWTPKYQTQLLLQNARQMHAILVEAFPGYTSAAATGAVADLRGLWRELLEHPAATFNDDQKDRVYKFLYLGQELLSRTSSNYKLLHMQAGLALMSAAAATATGLAMPVLASSSVGLAVTVAAGAVLYAASMFGSSLVEEEHYFWFWITSAWCAVRVFNGLRRRSLATVVVLTVSLAVLAVLRHYNVTGQKFVDVPTLAHYFSTPAGASTLWFLIALEYVSVFKNLYMYVFWSLPSFARHVFTFSIVFGIYFFKVSVALDDGMAVPSLARLIMPNLDSNDHVIKAQSVFIGLALAIVFHMASTFLGMRKTPGKFVQGIYFLAETLVLAQTSLVNTPILLAFSLLFSAARYAGVYSALHPAVIAVTTVMWQHVSFFVMGNSNSLASLDLANAYNGVRTYNMGLVGLMGFVSNWAGPLLFSLAAVFHLSTVQLKSRPRALGFPKDSLMTIYARDYLPILVFFHALALFAVTGSCYVLRDHLFIWTVFSPKLLYSTAWTVLQLVGVDVLLCSAVIGLSSALT
ncbi:alkaline-phosphatase-like protein [Dipodascopsis tothii]|uniref:alkaline-phosphatase-like protein n=1 Tax=Dipodascopsis tothii TaxID=44089 RepID=UPI0034CE8F9B